ncbi:MAG: UDP-N-acetylmuramoylalanyl-D-glutamyl-2,6-diaminopimelate--D-alanyl-D-alanyl ligase [Anaerocolumna sp.]|jgi:UDP-N-acetylmuramoyl-tripeptide--D-alanyl-D-alanine ligase|nr:UDP-N-acetylmuramoylalanyl-D-glutamyl-2,6-diaminopimelate--D-alanyl-D-alanyl ligase [Anaerocolumna sp.]
MEALSIKEIAMAVNGRVISGEENLSIKFVSTNSKAFSEGGLFVPIVGERFDGHNFINDAALNGAKACFTHRELDYIDGMTYIEVDNTLNALQSLGAYYRNKFNIPVIGITGSVGKTTTKEMVSAALETRYKVLKTEGNMNSQVGLPLMMLKLDSTHEIAVIEMGMSEEGEMERLAKIARPEVAIVTNIGVSHIAQLKTRENIRKEKLNIINEFKEGSLLFVNGNDSLLQEIITNRSLDVSTPTREKLDLCKVITYGEGSTYDYRASDIIFADEKTSFTFNDSKEVINLSVLGMHNVYNALAALAVAEHYHIPVSTSKEGLRNYSPIAMRGQILEVNGIKIIDDSYNASPDSMKSGIEVLKTLSGIKRKFAVLADIKELGEISKQSHYEVGEFLVNQPIDGVITVGEEALEIAKALRDNNSLVNAYTFTNNEEVLKFLSGFLGAGDGVLVKGSRGMKTDEIVKGLTNPKENLK